MFMSNSNIKDEKQMGNNDKDQRDKDQKTSADRQPGGQRQQSTGQPEAPGGGQQGGQNDNRTGTQQGGSGAGKSSDNDPNRKGGRV
jgi:hypothetical protein